MRYSRTNIVIAISEIAKDETLSRHIYNTAMNSVKNDKMPSPKTWRAIEPGDLKHQAWMHEFAFRSGQYPTIQK